MSLSPLNELEGVALQHDRLDVGDVVLHVVSAGPPSGPPVILLHGFPELWFGWRKQIPALAKAGYRVIVPDQRGYGSSDRPAGVANYAIDALVDDIAGLQDALGLERSVVVGHDWGAAVAWRMAARLPERVVKLGILNVPHPSVMLRTLKRSPRQLMRSWYMFAFQVPGVADRLLAANDGARLAGALKGTSRKGSFTRDDLVRYRAAWTAPGATTGMLSWYRAMFRNPPAPIGGKIQPKTLMIWGAQDHALGAEMAAPSVARCEDGELVMIDDATHWVQHDAADEVNTRLLAFLQG